jgi:hypothetical protein
MPSFPSFASVDFAKAAACRRTPLAKSFGAQNIRAYRRLSADSFGFSASWRTGGLSSVLKPGRCRFGANLETRLDGLNWH